MLVKNVVLITRKTHRNIFNRNLLRALSSTSGKENGTVRNGILFSDSSDIDIPTVNLCDLIYERIEPFQKFKAIECSLSGKSYSYKELRTKARNFARFLRLNLNLQQGDVVAIVLANRPECAVAALGMLEAGITVTSMNPQFTTAELAKLLSRSSAKAVITQSSSYTAIQSALQSSKDTAQVPIILVKEKQADSIFHNTIDFDEATDKRIDGPELSPANPSDIAFLPFSSGTTGLPKSTQLTHANLVAAIHQQCHPDLEYSEPPSDQHQDALPAILPFSHILGFSTELLISIFKGVKLVTQPKFIPDKFVDLLKNHKITYLLATPPLVLFLTSNDAVTPEHLKHLKYITSGAAPLGELDEERFLAKAGSHLKIYQGYGMSESSMVATTATKTMDHIKAAGSVGKPIPNTRAKIVSADDLHGSPLGPNEVGELLIKGPQVMIGYRNAPEENENAFVSGWLRTGDVASYDDRGLIFIKDRVKEIIKVRGYQVAPAELEELIRNFPAVEDAGVIGIPHPIFGEVPKAYVVGKPKVKLDTKELEEYVNKNVIKYKKLLGGIEIIDVIPKNPSGKILRRALKERFLASS